MAITSLLNNKALILQFDAGIVDGKQKVINKTFNNINEQATDEKLFSSAEIIRSLQEKNMLKVSKREMHTLSDL